MWKRSVKKEASEKTDPVPWDPYMLRDNIDSNDDELLRRDASSRAAAKIEFAAKTELAAKSEEFAVASKTEGVEGLQDHDDNDHHPHDDHDDQQRVRSAQGQIPAKKVRIKKVRMNSLRAALAEYASTTAATAEMPVVDSCSRSLTSAPLPIHQSFPSAHRGTQTKRKAPDDTARSSAASMSHEHLVQVKKPELPLDEPAAQETLQVAGSLSQSSCSETFGENLRAKTEVTNWTDEQGQECRRDGVIKQGEGGDEQGEASDDWRNFDPPQCVTCGECRWPAWTSKKGRAHCGFCLRPERGRPPCTSCGKLTWDGLTGPGKRWFCEACFVDDRAVDMRPLWTGWFRERRNHFPEVFASNGPAFYEGSACGDNAQEEEEDTRRVQRQLPVPSKSPRESDVGRHHVKDEKWFDPAVRQSSPVPDGHWRGKTPKLMPARSWTKQGQRVRLRGLHRRAEWNGASGTVCEYQEDSSGGRRVTVAIDACYYVTVKESNIEQLVPSARPSSWVGNQRSSRSRSRSPRQLFESRPSMKRRLPTPRSRAVLRAASQPRIPSMTRRLWFRRPPRNGRDSVQQD